VDKLEMDAFAGTGLAELIAPGSTLVIAGLASDYCIRATTLSALRRGCPVQLVSGAHAAYDDDEPAGVISRKAENDVAAAGAKLVDREDVTFRQRP
jgi:nicotinamidase-related amidase